MEVNKIQLNIIKNNEVGENIGGVSSGASGGVFVFQIDGMEETAMSGMTWEQWVNSEYNYGYYIENGNVLYNSGFGGIIQKIDGVKSSDVINAGASYYRSDYSGGLGG